MRELGDEVVVDPVLRRPQDDHRPRVMNWEQNPHPEPCCWPQELATATATPGCAGGQAAASGVGARATEAGMRGCRTLGGASQPGLEVVPPPHILPKP